MLHAGVMAGVWRIEGRGCQSWCTGAPHQAQKPSKGATSKPGTAAGRWLCAVAVAHGNTSAGS